MIINCIFACTFISNVAFAEYTNEQEIQQLTNQVESLDALYHSEIDNKATPASPPSGIAVKVNAVLRAKINALLDLISTTD
jgi:hypothetical protein